MTGALVRWPRQPARVPDPNSVLFLEVDDVIGMYAELFGCSFDVAAAQLLDRAGLEGGLARPRWYAEMGEDLAVQAAALAQP